MPTVPDYVVRVCRYQAGAGAPGFVGARCHCLGMPRTSSPDGLADLLQKQSSVVSRAQLLAVGMKDNAMQYRIRRGGPWQTLLPGVYLSGERRAELFAEGDGRRCSTPGRAALITGPTALMHHSIRSGSAVDVIDVLVPVGRQRVSAGFARLHRTARMPVRTSSAGPLRLTLVPRAVADTARQLTELRDVRAVVADAVQLGRCTVSQLADELRTGPVRGSAAVPLGSRRGGRWHQVYGRRRSPRRRPDGAAADAAVQPVLVRRRPLPGQAGRMVAGCRGRRRRSPPVIAAGRPAQTGRPSCPHAPRGRRRTRPPSPRVVHEHLAPMAASGPGSRAAPRPYPVAALRHPPCPCGPATF